MLAKQCFQDCPIFRIVSGSFAYLHLQFEEEAMKRKSKEYGHYCIERWYPIYESRTQLCLLYNSAKKLDMKHFTLKQVKLNGILMCHIAA